MANAKSTAKTPEVINEPTNLPAAVNRPQSAAMTTRNDDLPDYLAEMGDEDGKENIGREDVAIPRLALAQKMSPEIDPEQPDRFIEGLKQGDFFNTQTKEIYGPGPLEFSVFYIAPPRFIEFNSPEPGSGIKDPNVPHDDPRTQWTKGADGKPIKPAAMKFYNYIVVLWPNMEIIGLSFKSTGIKIAKQFNMKIEKRKGPVYAAKFKVWSVTAPSPKGPFKQIAVDNSDIASEVSAVKPNGDLMPQWLRRDLVEGIKEYFDKFKDKKNVVIDVSPVEDEPVDDSMAANPDM